MVSDNGFNHAYTAMMEHLIMGTDDDAVSAYPALDEWTAPHHGDYSLNVINKENANVGMNSWDISNDNGISGK
ncbi:hypothetical protein [Parasitella parasitica]|uniref:Uncharacterized protein n=1 Tax=Parasitella parasitica TaxID=35722 RepID=A0A0B7MP96_9FUNG|nr:hypothetical protein [Parasitella parasitica]